MESVRSAINFDKEKFSGMKVLMVDDTPSNLDILGHILKHVGSMFQWLPMEPLP